MKLLKLAVIPAALVATSAFAEEPVEVASSYDAEAGIVANTTSQLVDGTKTLFKTATHPGAVSVELGSLGYGANLAWSVSDKVELQAGWTGGDISVVDTEVNGNDSILNWKKFLGSGFDNFNGNLKVDLDYNNPYVGVQVRPFSNWLTVGSGVMFQDNTINASLVAGANTGAVSSVDKTTPITMYKTYEIPQGTTIGVDAEYKNDLAPYLSLGFRPNIDKKWGVYGELGMAYTGGVTAKANVAIPAGYESLLRKTNQTSLTADAVKAKLVSDVESKVSDKLPEWYPIAKLGVTYRF